MSRKQLMRVFFLIFLSRETATPLPVAVTILQVEIAHLSPLIDRALKRSSTMGQSKKIPANGATVKGRGVQKSPKLAAVSTQKSPRSKHEEDISSGVSNGKQAVVDFSVIDFNLDWETSVLIRTWQVLLATAAFFDFIAVMLKKFIDLDDEEDVKQRVVVSSLLLGDYSPQNHWEAVVEWLQANGSNIGLLFSVMWFTDTFIKAHRRRVKASRELDRTRLLREIGQDCDDEHWWKGAWGVYYRTVAMQLLLLPVGFFVFCYNGVCRPDGDVFQIVHRTNDIDIPDEYETFTTHANISLCFAILKHLAITFSRRTGANIRKFGHSQAKSFLVWLFFRAIHSPLRFRRRVLQVLVVFRWIKYLAPLLGATNKLFGNLVDLKKKYLQERAATKARDVRRKLWDEFTPEELREHCAVMIQKTFRAHRTRKYVSALNMIIGKKEQIAVMRLQKVFRGMAGRARLRLKRKRDELKALQAKEQAAREKKGKKTMDEAERRRMYKLQEELNAEAGHLLNETLLLRPNTSFAVAWKILFVVAIIFEISQLALKPRLQTYKHPETGKPLDIESILEHRLIPTPVSQLAACAPVSEPQNRGPGLVKLLRKVAQKIRRKKPVVETQREFPWYCGETYATAQGIYIQTFEFVIHQFLVLVGIVCFLDVFVTFFTGEINPNTGVLSPKAFFVRWFVPGLVLQLAVNPKMESASFVLSKVRYPFDDVVLQARPNHAAVLTHTFFLTGAALL